MMLQSSATVRPIPFHQSIQFSTSGRQQHEAQIEYMATHDVISSARFRLEVRLEAHGVSIGCGEFHAQRPQGPFFFLFQMEKRNIYLFVLSRIFFAFSKKR
jgi:hypothetical protein